MVSCQSGDRINNYILLDLLGTGSFGEVWRAKHHVFDEVVAVKVPTDPQYVRQLQTEGVAVHGLDHPNIVRAIDLDPFAQPPYLIMEYIDGPSLRQVIDDHPGGLPLRAVRIISEGVLNALQAAHQSGIIHRDIKPANILLQLRGQPLDALEPSAVKVSDFGLGVVGRPTAASVMQSDAPHGASRAGTLIYMAPEQRDGQQVDHRCDLYAVGMVLFEMLTGVRPQGHDMPSHLRPDVPAALDTLFRRCYTRRDNRWAHAADALDVLRSNAPAAAAVVGSQNRRTGLCHNCGAHTGPDDQFCIHCGFQLVPVIPRCQSCGAFTHRGDRFCILCGSALNPATPGPGVERQA